MRILNLINKSRKQSSEVTFKFKKRRPMSFPFSIHIVNFKFCLFSRLFLLLECLFICSCTYACMYVCMYECMHVCIYECIYAPCIFPKKCTYVFIKINLKICCIWIVGAVTVPTKISHAEASETAQCTWQSMKPMTLSGNDSDSVMNLLVDRFINVSPRPIYTIGSIIRSTRFLKWGLQKLVKFFGFVRGFTDDWMTFRHISWTWI